MAERISDFETILQLVRRLVAEAADVSIERVTPDTQIYRDGLSVDSLGAVLIAVRLAAELKTPDFSRRADLRSLGTPRRLAEFVAATIGVAG
jgi:acyl carrier protein